MRIVSRIPIRWRLTLVFAAVMTGVLIAAGLATVLHFRSAFEESAAQSPWWGDPRALEGARAAREIGLADLTGELAVTFPLVLLVATVTAYLLSGAALRPVERMRARAEVISADRPGERLPVPPARDEIRRLGRTLNAMLARLETALARERQFVADASHELRTPLSLLKTELELAVRRPRSVAELTAALGSALEETDRLVQLTENLLRLACTDNAHSPQPGTSTPLAPLIAEAADRFRNTATAAGRQVIVDELSAEPAAAVDRDPLDRMVDGLLDNALRHGRGDVRLRAFPASGPHGPERVEIHVLDDGPGFPEEFLPRAFERFSQPDAARGGSTAGLGLAIVAALARSAGGSAHVRNRPEGGADAWVAVPSANTKASA